MLYRVHTKTSFRQKKKEKMMLLHKENQNYRNIYMHLYTVDQKIQSTASMKFIYRLDKKLGYVKK